MKRRKVGGSGRQARLAALFEFLEARTSADIRQSLNRHPELLDDETDALKRVIAGRCIMKSGRFPGRREAVTSPQQPRWIIVRRAKPERRQMRSLAAYQSKTGWRYSIICTNIPDSGIGGVPGSHHPQCIDVVHCGHAVAETGGVRAAKAMELRELPSKSWRISCGWVIATNIVSWAPAMGQAEAASAADGSDRHRQSRRQIVVTAADSPIMAPWSCCIRFRLDRRSPI
jgi:hypothetical protein